MRGPFVLQLSVIAGFLLVQVALIAAVLSHPFKSVDPQAAWNESQTGYYFIQAQAAAKRLLANPSAHWDHYALDDKTYCALAGEDIWYASGTVRVPDGTSDQIEPWGVCFRPDQFDAPLSVMVGSRVSGDLEVIKRLAREQASPDATSPNHAP